MTYKKNLIPKEDTDKRSEKYFYDKQKCTAKKSKAEIVLVYLTDFVFENTFSVEAFFMRLD